MSGPDMGSNFLKTRFAARDSVRTESILLKALVQIDVSFVVWQCNYLHVYNIVTTWDECEPLHVLAPVYGSACEMTIC